MGQEYALGLGGWADWSGEAGVHGAVRRLDNSWARAWTSSSGHRRTVCTGARLLLGAWPVRGVGQTAWVLSENFSASCNAVILL